MDTFCGSVIKEIKKSKNNTSDKIVVSTCYFHNFASEYSALFNLKNLAYLDGLISNIETFQMKIERFTSNPEKWCYRVYIDKTILNITSIINNVIEKSENRDGYKYYSKSLQNKSDNEIINELDYNFTNIRKNIINNYNILVFLEKLLNKYINNILSSSDVKYDNIEIYTSNEIETYGKLIRYHPLTQKENAVVIFRNCSNNLTPIDILIQNYWIIDTPDLEFMEYVDKMYDFTVYRNIPSRKNWYMMFYDKASNNVETRANKIRHFGYDRIMAGLISAKINNTSLTFTGS